MGVREREKREEERDVQETVDKLQALYDNALSSLVLL